MMMLLCCLNTVAENKHALVFGLGKQEDSSWAKINGDKDADYVVAMLKGAGFRDIRVLKNEKATKQNMAQAFIDLAKVCKLGDIVYIHYSGHGQLITDIDGDEAQRWSGKHAQWDESWVPYDAYMTYCAKDRGEKHFTDDEIAGYLSTIKKRIGKKGKIYVAIDSCHSGDATMGTDDEVARGVDAKFNIPRRFGVKQAKTYKEQWVTISACKPFQIAFEQKQPIAGKLTYSLYELGSKIFSMSNAQLQRFLQEYINKHPGRLPQNPVVSGNN